NLSSIFQVQYRKLFLMIFVLGIGGTFSYGFQVSMISFPSMYIKNFINDTWQERYHSVIDDQTLTLLWSFIVSAFSIGGFLGSISSRYLSAKYGKKKCLTFNNLLLIAAAFFWGFSKMAKSFEMILIGRFLCGLYIGSIFLSVRMKEVNNYIFLLLKQTCPPLPLFPYSRFELLFTWTVFGRNFP
uniref:Major facilitator superfamily (MFS) profile domain-containing protein n=1 Tax=Chelonoidis abingdonii TaxID=106734 RepID=A0A8C0J2M3_CHEAB